MRSASCWDNVGRHEACDAFWLSDPSVRERVNRRISGDGHVWPITWFRQQIADRLPFPRALSIGCGLGALERELVRAGIADRVTGVDLAAAPLAHARRLAQHEGMAGRIRYVQSEASDLMRHRGAWDAVFFHGALHHIEDVEATLALARASLESRGVLYLDEYVGRSRDDWRLRHLIGPNLAYRLVPRAVRRTYLIRSPVTEEDPTEQIHSADILPALERHFRVLERRDYGGNLLLLLAPSLRPAGPGGPTPRERERAVRRLLDLEDLLFSGPLWTRARSFHTVLWAEPRPTTISILI